MKISSQLANNFDYCSAVDAEYSKINLMSEAGEFSHCDDEANAYFVPEVWERIAIRATLGELNAIVEWELENLASSLFARRRLWEHPSTTLEKARVPVGQPGCRERRIVKI
jgi:hypothetical protein